MRFCNRRVIESYVLLLRSGHNIAKTKHMFYFPQILFVMSLSFNEQPFKENIFSSSSCFLLIEVKFEIASIEKEKKTNK